MDVESRLNHFKLDEFESPDVPGSGKMMDWEFLVRLDCLRGEMNKPFKINSGYRSQAHNKKIGGARNSPHLLGLAADIKTRGWTKQERYRLLELAKGMGFRGIGIAPTFVHLDTMRRTTGNQTAWRYDVDGIRKVELTDFLEWA